MYLRFSTLQWDPQATRKLGALVVANDLLDDGALDARSAGALRAHLDWFDAKLATPKVLDDPASRRALSWFKEDAQAPIERIWEVVEILRAHGVEVAIHHTRDPGVVIYQDERQVVAKPHRGTRVPW